MLRFICHILNRPYEPCKSCETLKQQLAFANEEKRELTNVLLSIVKPKEIESAPIEINPITQTATLFSRRRAALEERDRLAAQTAKSSTNLGKPDINIPTDKNSTATISMSVESLEKELGIEEKVRE